MEPLPKQGCELPKPNGFKRKPGLSGTPAEAGVRGLWPSITCGSFTGLSGTPAEAGVRDGVPVMLSFRQKRLSGTPAEAGVRAFCLRYIVVNPIQVSVEPLPKQGCELADT